MWHIEAYILKYLTKALIQPVHLTFMSYECKKQQSMVVTNYLWTIFIPFSCRCFWRGEPFMWLSLISVEVWILSFPLNPETSIMKWYFFIAAKFYYYPGTQNLVGISLMNY